MGIVVRIKNDLILMEEFILAKLVGFQVRKIRPLD
jgi:hypothetical protein